MKAIKTPVFVWPTFWMGGSSDVTVEGINTIRIDSNGGEVCRFRTDNGKVTDEMHDRAYEIVNALNSFKPAKAALQTCLRVITFGSGKEGVMPDWDAVVDEIQQALKLMGEEKQ